MTRPADLVTPRYTKLQMVELATASGRSATERLFTDWQAAGLIDKPFKRGLGRGRGLVALWPESQLRLWFVLLDKRRETTQVPNLCNLPVGLWLYFGDDYASLRQVRKCMTTWAQRYGSSRGHKLAKQMARKLLEDLPLAPLSKNVKADLVSAMASALLHGLERDEDRRALRDRLLSVVVPPAETAAQPNHAASVVEMVLVRLLAAHHLSQGSVPDHIFEWARVWHLFGLRTYMEALDKGQVPASPGTEPESERPDFEKLMTAACRDLMSSIGMALGLGKEETLPAPFFHPDSWRGVPTGIRIGFQVEPSPIILPGGRRAGRLRIEVTGQGPVIETT